jgi:hypothetical protein
VELSNTARRFLTDAIGSVLEQRFFALFGLAFWVLALNALLVVLAAVASEHQHYVYLVRLGAFLLIIAAIADKNRSSGPSRP